jgi:hypothetical protein
MARTNNFELRLRATELAQQGFRVDLAKNEKDPELRKKAIFWLGQTHDPRALAYFEQILEH